MRHVIHVIHEGELDFFYFVRAIQLTGHLNLVKHLT